MVKEQGGLDRSEAIEDMHHLRLTALLDDQMRDNAVLVNVADVGPGEGVGRPAQVAPRKGRFPLLTLSRGGSQGLCKGPGVRDNKMVFRLFQCFPP